ncbi:MAG: hypothetical protein M3122_06635 [Actinomycetota bacterium]|nr:hypothetical protein [Actinomycetota bacterium]
MIGSLITKGYAEDLAANAPAQAPGRLISALENPQALVSDEAHDSLTNVASAIPGREEVVDEVIGVARQSLSGSIHEGFVFVLFAVLASIAAALLMKDVRLREEPAAAQDSELAVGYLLADVVPDGQTGAARR